MTANLGWNSKNCSHFQKKEQMTANPNCFTDLLYQIGNTQFLSSELFFSSKNKFKENIFKSYILHVAIS